MATVEAKVVHVTTLHPTFDIRIFHKECRTLAEVGYDVTLIAPFDHDETVDDVRVLGIPRYGNRLMRMTLGGWRAYRLAKAQQAEIYHFHDPELLPWMALLKPHAHVIYDVHEDLAKSVRTKRWLPPFLRSMVAAVSRAEERFDSRGMQLVLAEDSYAKDYTWAPATTVLNLPRVEDLLAISEEKHAQPTVAYFGAVNASRGSFTMLNALGRLKNDGFDVALECVGPASEGHLAELRERAKQLGVKLHAPGYTQATDGWRAVARCHAGLALLHPLPNYVESYPTKIFEYMALGLPVIASNFPLYREVVEGNSCGICVDPLDVAGIAAAIRLLVEDRALTQEMGERGKRAAELRYNWQTEADKLLRLYTELLSKSARN
jgi:glycosyltransferase involved in cell wall biosynthesis